MFINGGGCVSSGYQIDKSLRFRASGNTYLSRTFGTPTVANTWTWSGWVKPSMLITTQAYLFNTTGSGATVSGILFNSSYQLLISNSSTTSYTSTMLFRDPSAWYHIVVAQSYSGDYHQEIYVNGVNIFSGTAAAPQINSAQGHSIGRNHYTNSQFLDGYLSEVNFIDGQALTPSSFGQQNSDGVWVPKKYTGAYGNNGFYLPFNDGTSLTTLGYDKSGNSNNWALNNHSLTPGATYDWMSDTPTNNYATLNPLDKYSTSITVRNGGLDIVGTTTAYTSVRATQMPLSGKWYAEYTLSAQSSPGRNKFLLMSDTASLAAELASGIITFYENAGNLYKNKDAVATLIKAGTIPTGSILQIFWDADVGQVWFGIGNTPLEGVPGTSGASYTGLTGRYSIGVQCYTTTDTGAINFGQRPFTYTPPAGYKALCTANLTVPTGAAARPWEHYQVITVTKAGNTNFTLNWDASVYDTLFEIKQRNGVTEWKWVDGLRGYDKILSSNTTSVETTDANVIGVAGTTITLKSTLPDGTYVIYARKAGLAASRQTNTDGTITSTVSCNVLSGFAIVVYTGTGANATVGHGLGKIPSMHIAKNIGGIGGNWNVYHANQAVSPETGVTILNGTGVFSVASDRWNNTKPTSAVVHLGNNAAVNENTKACLLYVHAEIPGYSKFGSYIGNGSTDGPFVYSGLLAADWMTRCTNAISNWNKGDSTRSAYNPADVILLSNANNAELSPYSVDANSNGLKMRNTEGGYNTNNGTHIYQLTAKAPFQYANAR